MRSPKRRITSPASPPWNQSSPQRRSTRWVGEPFALSLASSPFAHNFPSREPRAGRVRRRSLHFKQRCAHTIVGNVLSQNPCGHAIRRSGESPRGSLAVSHASTAAPLLGGPSLGVSICDRPRHYRFNRASRNNVCWLFVSYVVESPMPRLGRVPTVPVASRFSAAFDGQSPLRQLDRTRARR